MPPQTTDERYFSFPILKWAKTDDGDITVYGRVTDGSVDADHQIVDSKWSGKALDEWLGTGGNMRVQHSPFLYPAGKGLALEVDRDGDGAHWLKALVVEDNAKRLVQKGVLRDFSIGVLDPQLSFRDPRAPEGTIVGGRVGEVSLVDRGSNKNSGFTIAKAAPDGHPVLLANKMWFADSPAGVHARMLTKKKLKSGRIVDSSGADRSSVPQDQFAGPGDTFPVDNRNDVSDAASLAHHAADPGAVRSRIRSIAEGKLHMSADELPPSIKSTVCPTCNGTGQVDGKMCKKCMGKVTNPDVAKGDAAGDYPGDAGQNDTSEQDYDAEQVAGGDDDGPGDADDDGPPKKANKKRKKGGLDAFRGNRAPQFKGKKKPPSGPEELTPGFPGASTDQRSDREHIEAGFTGKRRPRRGRTDPSSASGGAKGKTSKPAPLPAGIVDQEVEGSPFATKGLHTTAPLSMIALHAATCPVGKRSALKSLGYGEVKDAIPLREFQSLAMDAISKGMNDVADYYLSLIRTAEGIQGFDDTVLRQARKYYGPELFPPKSMPTHQDVAPSMFQGGYLSSGHPASSGAGYGSDGIPNAVHHNVEAGQFTRGYLSSGHPPFNTNGKDATFDQIPMQQAANAMQRFHLHAAGLWPELCSGANITQRDYTQGDGATGISASNHPEFPTAPGESGLTSQHYRKADDPDQKIRVLTKANKTLAKRYRALRAELDVLGAQPDPHQAAFRGIPMADGPVDRISHIDKALRPVDGDDEDQAEYRQFLGNLSKSGNPTLRMAAMDEIRNLLTSE